MITAANVRPYGLTIFTFYSPWSRQVISRVPPDSETNQGNKAQSNYRHTSTLSQQPTTTPSVWIMQLPTCQCAQLHYKKKLAYEIPELEITKVNSLSRFFCWGFGLVCLVVATGSNCLYVATGRVYTAVPFFQNVFPTSLSKHGRWKSMKYRRHGLKARLCQQISYSVKGGKGFILTKTIETISRHCGTFTLLEVKK